MAPKPNQETNGRLLELCSCSRNVIKFLNWFNMYYVYYMRVKDLIQKEIAPKTTPPAVIKSNAIYGLQLSSEVLIQNFHQKNSFWIETFQVYLQNKKSDSFWILILDSHS